MSSAFFTLYLLRLISSEKACWASSYSFAVHGLIVYKLSDFPMGLSKIRSFEKPINVPISVYRFEQGKLLNVFYSKNRKCLPTKKETAAAFWPWKKSLLLDEELLHSNLIHHLTRSSSRKLEVQELPFAATVCSQLWKTTLAITSSFVSTTNRWKKCQTKSWLTKTGKKR